MWAALSAFFVVLLIVIAGVVVYVGANLISFLQPILIPVAIAIILAYLLDPLVTELCRRGMGRLWAIIVIFVMALVALGRPVLVGRANRSRAKRKFRKRASFLHPNCARSNCRSGRSL